MSIRTDLAILGWDGDLTEREAVIGFQYGWNLGPALVVDGNAGPATKAAIAVSLGRHLRGLPNFSPSFNASEFRCKCGDGDRSIAEGCQRIWIRRSTVQMAEKFRARVGPFTPERACRCKRENDRVGGSPGSMHLVGRGLDVPIYDLTIAEVRKVTGCDGVGTYEKNGRLYARHFDDRGRWAQWPYPYKPFTPIKPRPDLATAPPAPTYPAPSSPVGSDGTSAPTSEEDELMAITVKNPRTGEAWSASAAFWSIWSTVLDVKDIAVAARNNSEQALAVVKQQAALGRPMTSDEVEEALRDAIAKVRAEGDIADDVVTAPTQEA